MTRIYTTITIQQPIETVFTYVTTPGNWPQWHPSSLGVQGATDHSLEVGEQVREEFRVAGRHGYVLWTVRERTAPRRWVIEGRIEGHPGGGTVAYTLSPPADGGYPPGAPLLFAREFSYSVRSPVGALLDLFVLRRRVTAESSEALRRLKRKLESPGHL